MSSLKLRLTVDVEYEPKGTDPELLHQILGSVIDHAVNVGAITDDTDAEMTTYEFRIDDVTTPQGVWFVWGETIESEAQLCYYTYPTNELMNAFLEGVDAGSGWLDEHQFDTEEEAREYLDEELRGRSA